MADIKIGQMVLGIYSTNCYFLYRDEEKDGYRECLVFDAPDNGAKIVEALLKNKLKPVALFLTHGHFDHMWGAEDFSKKSNTLIHALDKEREVLLDSQLNVSAMMGRPTIVDVDKYLSDGEEIELAGIKIKVIATPGHTAGSCSYYCPEAGLLIDGDTIFYESVGRTDFPTGNSAELERSAKEKIFSLPDETRIFPGHGEETSVGHEKLYNAFLG